MASYEEELDALEGFRNLWSTTLEKEPPNLVQRLLRPQGKGGLPEELRSLADQARRGTLDDLPTFEPPTYDTLIKSGMLGRDAAGIIGEQVNQQISTEESMARAEMMMRQELGEGDKYAADSLAFDPAVALGGTPNLKRVNATATAFNTTSAKITKALTELTSAYQEKVGDIADVYDPSSPHFIGYPTQPTPSSTPKLQETTPVTQLEQSHDILQKYFDGEYTEHQARQLLLVWLNSQGALKNLSHDAKLATIDRYINTWKIKISDAKLVAETAPYLNESAIFDAYFNGNIGNTEARDELLALWQRTLGDEKDAGGFGRDATALVATWTTQIAQGLAKPAGETADASTTLKSADANAADSISWGLTALGGGDVPIDLGPIRGKTGLAQYQLAARGALGGRIDHPGVRERLTGRYPIFQGRWILQSVMGGGLDPERLYEFAQRGFREKPGTFYNSEKMNLGFKEWVEASRDTVSDLADTDYYTRIKRQAVLSSQNQEAVARAIGGITGEGLFGGWRLSAFNALVQRHRDRRDRGEEDRPLTAMLADMEGSPWAKAAGLSQA